MIKQAFKYFIQGVTDNYLYYNGRARRAEFWGFLLFGVLFGVIASAVGLDELWSILLLIPLFCVSARRLHDIGRSGWWLLLILIPFFGKLLLIYFFATDSQPESNEWGNNPKTPVYDECISSSF